VCVCVCVCVCVWLVHCVSDIQVFLRPFFSVTLFYLGHGI
jgi:hypothetical protein